MLKIEVGNYGQPEAVGYRGWVVFDKAIVFERIDGELVVIRKT